MGSLVGCKKNDDRGRPWLKLPVKPDIDFSICADPIGNVAASQSIAVDLVSVPLAKFELVRAKNQSNCWTPA